MIRSASVLRLSLKFSELKACSSCGPLINPTKFIVARNFSQFQLKSVRKRRNNKLFLISMNGFKAELNMSFE